MGVREVARGAALFTALALALNPEASHSDTLGPCEAALAGGRIGSTQGLFSVAGSPVASAGSADLAGTGLSRKLRLFKRGRAPLVFLWMIGGDCRSFCLSVGWR